MSDAPPAVAPPMVAAASTRPEGPARAASTEPEAPDRVQQTLVAPVGVDQTLAAPVGVELTPAVPVGVDLTPAEPVAAQPSSARRNRWRLAGVVLAVGALLAITLFLVTDPLGSDDPAVGGPPGPAQATTAPPASPPAVVPPPAGSTDGLVATVAIRSGDLVEVSETVTWPDGGPLDVRLALPDLGAGSEVEASFQPSVTDLQVTLDGNTVQAVPVDDSTTAWRVLSPSGSAPRSMTVRYVLDGAVARSTPSQTGRALALVAPISQPAIGSLPVRIEIGYDGVLSIGCPRATDATGQVCGRRLEDRWAAEPPPGLPAVVVVQLDLPPLLG